MIRKFRTTDHPEADGRLPQTGDQQWTLRFPLEGGDDYLEVSIGKKGRDAIRAMLIQEESDDAAGRCQCPFCDSGDTFTAEDGWKNCRSCKGRFHK